jgi:hypothetical protein
VHHHHYNSDSESDTEDEDEEGRAGAFEEGGLVIMNNPSDEAALENPEAIEETLQQGFYEGQENLDPDEIQLD